MFFWPCASSLPTLNKPCCSFKCCFEMFPGAFTRGSVAFSLAGIVADCAPIAHSILPTIHTITHTFSPERSPGCLVTYFHLYVILNIVPPWKIHHCTVFHLSLTLPLICTRLIFTAASLLRPSCFKTEGVLGLFCVETESSKACLIQRNRYQYHSVAQ